ncbi:MAG TPA: BamA/TamA family outer membrane protein [Tepidisphaeraceae bacterium]
MLKETPTIGPRAKMKGFNKKRLIIAVLMAVVFGASFTSAQPLSNPTQPSYMPPVYSTLKGRRVEDIRILGNQRVPTSVIENVIRTRPGDAFDPAAVEQDYRAIYGLRRFANVEAKLEPTTAGVIVSFVVTETRQITTIAFRGNVGVTTPSLLETVDVHPGEAIDTFRISSAKMAIESIYRDKNFPFVHVDVDQDLLNQRGELVFNVVEGPEVTIRKVKFLGNHSFTDDKLKDQIQTKAWFFIFNSGTYDPEQVEDDVASVRRFYESKGFFDVRVGRKLIFSPNQREMQVTFVVSEGQRYRVGRLEFRGNAKLSEAELRRGLRMKPGVAYDDDTIQRDIRQMVRDYSPFGFIYEPRPQFQSPDYLRIDARRIFHKEAGTVDLVYQIGEGKPFRIGRIIPKGNTRTQDKVILREMRVASGQLYNSAEIADAVDRLRATPYFAGVSVTPVGDDPNYRDVIVEVAEQKTASFTVGAGINSNGGVGAAITYQQSNFDITDWPESWKDVFSERAFVGAGQLFRITLQPGTESSNASILWREPWLLDQPYSLALEAYYRDRQREHYEETRGGGRVTFGHRFDYVHSATLTLRGEDVNIHNIDDDPIRAPEILALRGHSTITSTPLQLRRDTTNGGLIPYQGTVTTVGWEPYGTLGGEFSFHKLTAGWDMYHTLYEDLLDRKTVFSLHVDAGYITGEAPFFERFYGGGIGSVRGFRFRGISPRSGIDEDPVGGNFSLTGSAEVSFPIVGEMVRGVVFTDVGDVESEVRIGTIRASVGAGIRLILPILGQTPVAVDFAYPINKDDQDDTQFISFSLGFSP